MSRSGILWIEDYTGRDHTNLGLSQPSAEGFANALQVERAFTLKNEEVTEKIFKASGQKAAQIEDADILYFSGHGIERGPVLGVASDLEDGVLEPKELSLGVGSLAYAAFDCCHMLNPDHHERWHASFHGLRYLLGFAGYVMQSESRGAVFAKLLTEKVPIPEAWRRAALETQPTGDSWSFLHAVQEGGVLMDEVWVDSEVPLVDPQPPLQFFSRTERGDPEPLPAESGTADRVTLFRTPQHDEDLGDIHVFARGDRWRWSQGTNAAFDLYPNNRSFWWRRDRSQRGIELFARQAAAPPAFSESIARARQHLEQYYLLDDRLSRGQTTVTIERHSTSAREGSPEELTRTVAFHVNYKYSLGYLPVLGPGAKLRVTFESEEVDEVFRFWREPVAEGGVDIISPDQARAQLLQSPGLRYLPEGAVELGPARLGYYALPPRQAQDFLLPVYEIRGTVTTKAFGTYEFIRFVQAVPERIRDAMPEGSAFHRPAVLP